MSQRIYVLNHHSRSPARVVDAIRGQGVEPIVVTDTTDYNLLRGTFRRWKGLFDNFRRIMMLGLEQEEDWVILLHDDVSVPDRLFERMAHVLQFAKPGMASFYNPSNQPFMRAARDGRHVMLTYTNYWTQCFCFHRAAIEPVLNWGTEVCDPEAPPAEDGYLKRYCSWNQVPVQVIMPSLIQHDGYAQSTFKIGAKVGHFERRSSTYDPTFDVWGVDWVTEFANPVWDGHRKLSTTGLRAVPTRAH